MNNIEGLLEEYALVLFAAFAVAFFAFLFSALSLRRNKRKDKKEKELLEELKSLLPASSIYLFGFQNDDSVLFDDSFYKDNNLKKKAIPYRVLLRCLDEEKRPLIRQLMAEGKDSQSVPLWIHFPGLPSKRELVLLNFSKGKLGLLVILHNLRKELEDKETSYAVEEHSEIHSTFMSSFSDEIREPLEAVVAFSGLLVDMHDSLPMDELHQYGRIINENNDKLLQYMESAFEESQVEEKEQEVALSSKNVARLMDEVVKSNSVIIPENLKLRLSHGDDKDFVVVNQQNLLQVASNLLTNAIQLTENNEIIMGWRSDSGFVYIFVEDGAKQLSSEQLTKVFFKYSNTPYQGMDISLNMVQKMNGDLRVSHGSSHGNRFEIILPKVGVI